MSIQYLEDSWPHKDKTPRPGQLESVDNIIQEFKDKDYILLLAPPGSGKSLIAITLANYLNTIFDYGYEDEGDSCDRKSYVLTTEKILQKQYLDDFSMLPKVKYLLGKSNYLCNREGAEEGTSYENGICHLLPEKEAKVLPCVQSCSYKCARKEARVGKVVISNYHYMLVDQDFIPDFARMPNKYLTIYDEAHNLEPILLDYTVVGIGEGLLKEHDKRLNKAILFLENVLPLIDTLKSLYEQIKGLSEDDVVGAISLFKKISNWYVEVSTRIDRFVKIEIAKLSDEYVKRGSSIEVYKDDRFKKFRYCQNFSENLKQANSKILNMVKSVEEENSIWVFDRTSDKVELKPVYASYLFKSSLDNLSDKKVFMSGTLCSKEVFCKTFNISEDRVGFLELPSLFPVENRPVYNLAVADMSYSNLSEGLKDCLKWVDLLVDLNPGKKVLIHSGNYNITEYISKRSKHKKIMFVPKPDGRQTVVDSFKEAKEGILISPSLMEGISLDYDLCRVQIFLKVPYLSLADKRIKVRMKYDPKWYAQQAISKIVQGSCRGVRHADDTCTTYILDSCFNGLYARSKDLFPKWFKDAIKTKEDFERSLLD